LTREFTSFPHLFFLNALHSLYPSYSLSKTSISKPSISFISLPFVTPNYSKFLKFLPILLHSSKFINFSHKIPIFSLSSQNSNSIPLLSTIPFSSTQIPHFIHSSSSLFFHSPFLLKFSIFFIFHTPISFIVEDFSQKPHIAV